MEEENTQQPPTRRSLRRTFRWTLQLMGVLIVGAVILTGVVAWRLTSGPLSIGFLTPYFENALSDSNKFFQIDVEDTILTWVGGDRTVDIRLVGARILNADGNLVAQIPDLSVALSARSLLRGDVVPQSLSVLNPALRVVRRFDGSVDVGMGESDQSRNEFSEWFLRELFLTPDRERRFGFLTRVEIVNGSLLVDDRRLGVVWRAPRANMSLSRDEDGLSGWADLDIRLGGNTAKLAVSGSFSPNDPNIPLSLTYSNVAPASLASISPQFDVFKNFNLPLGGQANLVVRRDGSVVETKFKVRGGAGTVELPLANPVVLNIQSANFEGSYDSTLEHVEMSKLTLDFGEKGELRLPAPVNHAFPVRRIAAAGSFTIPTSRFELRRMTADLGIATARMDAIVHEIAGQYSLVASGEVEDVQVATFDRLWPEAWGDLTRSWIKKNITAGEVPLARSKLNGRWVKGLGFQVDSLIGDMFLSDMTVDYLSPMPKAMHAHGRAKFDQKSFEINVDEGEVAGLAVTRGRIVFTDLDKFDQFADIELDFRGGVQNALKLIDHEPLKFADAVGFETANVAGEATGSFRLNFLLERTMTQDSVKVQADAKLKNVAMDGFIAGLDITGGEFTVNADNQKLDVVGKAKLSGVDSTLSWRENFAADAPTKRSYMARTRLPESDWRRLLFLDHVPVVSDYISGPIQADVDVDFAQQERALVSARLNLSQTNLSIPEFAWRKSPRVQAVAEIKAELIDGKLKRIPEILLNGGGLDVEASADMNARGGLREIALEKVRFGGNNLRGSLRPAGGGWQVSVVGDRLDLVALLEDETDDAEDGRDTPPVRIDLDVKQVQLYPGKSLADVKGELFRSGQVWRSMSLEARLPNQRSLVVKMLPQNGKRVLQVAARDAGEMLKVFDIYDDIVGGQLGLRAEFEDDTPRSKVSGNVAIENFRLIDAPVIARLLGVASIVGIPDGLTGMGLSFQKMDLPFTLENHVIEIKDGKAGGFNLGITASGTVDTKADLIDVKGSIAPLDKLNSLLGNIPLLGVFFSAGEKGGGVFAAEYTMKGDVKDPEITANPLSALTPGILRRIFDVFDVKEPGPREAPRPKVPERDLAK